MIILASLTDIPAGIIEKFGVDLPLLIAQAINFLLVAFLIWKFAFKKILSTIKEREKKIAESLKNADRIKLELDETEKKQKETLEDASIKAKNTVTVAQEQAKSYIEAQKEEARKQTDDIIHKARSSMELERQRVLKDAKDEIASLVVLATSRVLERELKEEEKSRFTETAVKEIKLSS